MIDIPQSSIASIEPGFAGRTDPMGADRVEDAQTRTEPEQTKRQKRNQQPNEPIPQLQCSIPPEQAQTDGSQKQNGDTNRINIFCPNRLIFRADSGIGAQAMPDKTCHEHGMCEDQEWPGCPGNQGIGRAAIPASRSKRKGQRGYAPGANKQGAIEPFVWFG